MFEPNPSAATVACPERDASLPFLVRFGKFIRFSHTLFALPFALISMLVAASGWPGWGIAGWILWCMFSARTLAMLFNRLADWDMDQENPRTENRHRLISRRVAQGAFVIFTAAFVFGAVMLNVLCAVLSPVAIALICFYSISKRFTSWCHAFLGIALSAAPMGAWAGVTGELVSVEPYLLAGGVLVWVFGFDLIYATLDVDFDRQKGLFSFPARYGLSASRRASIFLHTLALLLFLLFGWSAGLSGVYYLCWGLCVVLLIFEQHWARSAEINRLNRAFFHSNAGVSILLLTGVVLDSLL